MYSLEKKTIVATTLLLLFAVMSIPAAFAEKPSVNVEPATISVDIDEEVTVNITIRDLPSPGLFCYELKLYFNASLLEATDAEIPAGHFLTPEDESLFIVVRSGVINNTLGVVSFAATLLAPEQGKTGSGVLCTVTFRGKAEGVSSLTLPGEDLILVDPEPQVIPEDSYDVNPSQITVIPELSTALMALLFLVATAATLVLRKRIKPNTKERIV